MALILRQLTRRLGVLSAESKAQVRSLPLAQLDWQKLESDLRSQILPRDAVLSDEENRFGDVYEIRGTLVGPNGVELAITTIWMIEHETQQTKFITLYPNKRAK
ncbi:MAG: DUF6883 domain-containing protein [Thermosynechococcaceae cyanobacterium]